MSGLFYNLGKKAGPKVRKAKWIWHSITAGQADTIKAEHEVGKDLACEIRDRSELDTEPQAGQLLSEVGSHLTARVANKLRRFSFEVIKGSEPNAFALPGGFIFVTRSLLELCEWNQDQIAFILAHEMAHVIRGHAMDRIIAGSAIAASAKAASIRGLLNTWLGKVGFKFLESAYSQDMELEADTLAARLATAAGYDTGAAKQLFSRLKKLNRSDNQSSFWNYFSSHPTFNIRINNIDRN
ncbi:MAG: M48 family metallopeptidase [Planctomycetes bacterium]|nr:M48 family metallopeptidase [Planctomycetota bacterium]